MIKNKKILVIGAGGFIGGHLVNRLLKMEILLRLQILSLKNIGFRILIMLIIIIHWI